MTCCQGEGLVDRCSSGRGVKAAHVPVDNVDIRTIHLFLWWLLGGGWPKGSWLGWWWLLLDDTLGNIVGGGLDTRAHVRDILGETLW